MVEADLKLELDRILTLEQLSPVFQPIVSLNRQEILGYEALIRGPAQSLLHLPGRLFDTAIRYNRLTELDFLCRKLVLRRYAKLNLPGQLFMNVAPACLGEDDFISGQTLLYLQNHGIDPHRVVIEITETHPIEDLALLQQALHHYRQMGFQVALDDLGAGCSGLKLWSEVNPDFIKIDGHFIQNVDTDQTKRQFIRSILEIAESLGCEAIPEGIESKREYAELRKLGIRYAQGHYFGKPQTNPVSSLDKSLFRDGRRDQGSRSQTSTFSLIRSTPTIDPDASIREAEQVFKANEGMSSIAAVRHGKPHGLLLRREMLSFLTGRSDSAGDMSIADLINRHCMVLDKNLSLDRISQMLCGSVDRYTEEFIVTDHGRYFGTGRLLDVLGQTLERRHSSNLHLNALTRLPGNVPLQKALDSFFQTPAREFVIAHCDIDHFSAYNRAYGYDRGDEVIQLLGRLLRETADPDLDFIGHLGGDDFIALFGSPDWIERCNRLVETFQRLARERYSVQDRRMQGIAMIDERGLRQNFPALGLSVGVLRVSAGKGRPLQVRDFTDLARSFRRRHITQLRASSVNRAQILPSTGLYDLEEGFAEAGPP